MYIIVKYTINIDEDHCEFFKKRISYATFETTITLQGGEIGKHALLSRGWRN